MQRLDNTGILRMLLGFSLDSMRKYHRFVEDYFVEHEKELGQKMKELEEDVHKHRHLFDEASIADAYDDLTNDFVDIDKNFRLTFRQSIIIHLYSYLEGELRMACNTFKAILDKSDSFEEVKANGDFEKTCKYLKEIGVDISKFSHWQFITNLKKVRDIIVHKESKVRMTERRFSSIQQFHRGNFEFEPLAEGAEIYGLKLDKTEFIDLSFSNVEEFLKDLIETVPNR